VIFHGRAPARTAKTQQQRGPKAPKQPAANNPKPQRVHVVSRKDGWAVKTEGNAKASRLFERKEAAVEGARKLSKGNDVIIHKKDGSIQRWERPAKEE
jgi:hypothetical protein